MAAASLVSLLQWLGIILPLAGALALASFLIWCVIGAVLWLVAHRRHDDAAQGATDPEWFESLPDQSPSDQSPSDQSRPEQSRPEPSR